jgi:hypothetical protein
MIQSGMMFKRVCSWCNATLTEGATSTAPVTHSICPRCVMKVDQQIAAMANAKALASSQRNSARLD